MHEVSLIIASPDNVKKNEPNLLLLLLFFKNQKAASLPERAGLNVFPSTRPDQTERNNR